MHHGKRQDVDETRVVVDGVIFHIPMLKTHGLYVLCKCICERQSRLPLANCSKDGIQARIRVHPKRSGAQIEIISEISKRGTEYKKAEGVGISYCRKIDEAY
ncbi:hypothetical protein DYY65_06480 [Nitrososphaera sp. AFS]|nr:hypothetical protein [Nitrososphaera sp. AFS]